MDDYIRWNDALAAYFFKPEMSGRSVYLDVSRKLIADMHVALGPEATDFVIALKRGPRWVNSEGICRKALDAFQGWRDHNVGFPPYIAYLCLFVLAAGARGDFSPNAYYPRLRTLLHLQGEGTVPGFELMRRLWDDLEDWATLDKQGELGVFQSRTIGGHVHIGYPLAQLILTEEDRRALPQVFSVAGLHPASIHPAGELVMALRGPSARQLMSTRTIRLVENPNDELHGALIDSVSDELSGWDGIIEPTAPGGKATAQVFGGLRVCLELDDIAGRARAYLRCKLNCEFPEVGLGLEEGLQADEDVNGWSLPIKNNETGETVDASLLDWRNGVTMRSRRISCQLKLLGREVRIFTSGIQDGISDLVETHVLPRGQPFYLCYPEDAWPQLEHWATTQCLGFKELDIATGLPQSWRLAQIEEALYDHAGRAGRAGQNAFPILSFPPGVHLRLMGGIRSGAGNNFFSFAPPLVALIGGAADTEVYCNGNLLSVRADSEALVLPGDIPARSRVNLEARSGQSVLQRRSLFLTDDFNLPQGEPILLFSSDGTVADPGNDKPSVAGAYIESHSPGLATTVAEVFYDLEHEIGGLRGFLVGQNPGEIISWPSERFPSEWTPAWAINKLGRRQWEALFIGRILGSTPPDAPPTPPPRKLAKWKHAIWYLRNRTTPPELPAERALWHQLQEVARDV